MVLTLLAIRQRETGADITVRDADTDRVFFLWNDGPNSAVVTTAWAEGHVNKILASEAAEKADADADATIGTSLAVAFVAWLKANKTVSKVREHLIALARLYRGAP